MLLGGCGAESVPRATSPVHGLNTATTGNYVAIPDQPLAAPAGQVTQVDGSTWTYRSPAAGRLTLLYFGYTSCPDVCPTTLADLVTALDRLPADLQDKVDVQFVSTDPHRDTAKQIRRWLGGFGPGLHGGRAPIDDVIAAARAYGISIAAPKVTAADYQVTHGGQLMVLQPGGDAVGYFRELAGASAYAAKLPSLITKYAGDSPDRLAASSAGDLSLSKGWVTAAKAQQSMSTSAAYFTLTNSGSQDDALVSVDTDLARHSMLHRTKQSADGSSGTMERVTEMQVPAHGRAVLGPGGYHVMLMDLTRSLAPGTTIPVRLTFRSGATMDVKMPVIDREDRPGS